MLNCRNFLGVLLAGLVLGLLPMHAHAEQFVLICVPGGPGSTEEAQERIDLFLTELAKGTGEALSGVYANTKSGCDKWIGEKKPRFALFAHSELATRGKALKASPLLEAIPQDKLAMRYHIVGKVGATMDSLKGGKLLSPHWKKEAFLSRHVFQMSLKEAFKGKRGSALRSIKKVAKGKAEAALLNEAEFQAMKDTKFGSELVAVLSSIELPGLALVELGGETALGRKVRDSGKQLCKRSPDACKGVEMSQLKPADTTRYDGILTAP